MFPITPTSDAKLSEFRKLLQGLLNSCSMENGSSTPDFILAEYLTDCLAAYDKALQARAGWYEAGSTGSVSPGVTDPSPVIRVKDPASGQILHGWFCAGQCTPNLGYNELVQMLHRHAMAPLDPIALTLVLAARSDPCAFMAMEALARTRARVTLDFNGKLYCTAVLARVQSTPNPHNADWIRVELDLSSFRAIA